MITETTTEPKIAVLPRDIAERLAADNRRVNDDMLQMDVADRRRFDEREDERLRVYKDDIAWVRARDEKNTEATRARDAMFRTNVRMSNAAHVVQSIALTVIAIAAVVMAVYR